MIDPAVLRAMLNAGCSADQIVAVAEDASRAADEKKASKRAGNAERQRRHRQRNASNALQSVTDVSDGDNLSPKKEIPPTPPKEKTTPIHSEAKASSNTPRAELETVLDAERAGAVLDHRKRIGKPLTAYAAKQLAAKMGLCPDPNFAADEMVSNGWQGFKPEWLESRTQRATSPPGRRMNTAVEANLARRIKRNEPTSGRRDYRDAELLPPDKPELRALVGNLGEALTWGD